MTDLNRVTQNEPARPLRQREAQQPSQFHHIIEQAMQAGRVAQGQITTYGKSSLLSAVRDAGRVYGIDVTLLLIAANPLQSWHANEQAWRKLDFDDLDEVINLAKWLAGFDHNESMHAAGVVIWDKGDAATHHMQDKPLIMDFAAHAQTAQSGEVLKQTDE